MRSLIAWIVLGITALSLWWTTIKARRILRASLGRKLRTGEETSLRSWMQASDASLHEAAEQLERNPFERFLRFLAMFGIWRGDVRRLTPSSRVIEFCSDRGHEN
jgi:hypothetical protein